MRWLVVLFLAGNLSQATLCQGSVSPYKVGMRPGKTVIMTQAKRGAIPPHT